MNRPLWTALSAAFALVLVLTLAVGCATDGTETEGPESGEDNAENGLESMTLTLVEEWAVSRHANIVTSAASNDGCKNCHDGLIFAATGGGMQGRMQVELPSDTEDANDPGTDEGGEESVRDFPVGVDCRACHLGAGAQIADEGSVEMIPSVDVAEGGLGSLCMACHNGWHLAGKGDDGALTAPHTSVQTDMFFGVNTLEAGNDSTATAGSSVSIHRTVDDTCVGCHVARSDREANHTFAVEGFEGCSTQGCHEGDMTDGGDSDEDFDGDGSIEKFAVEVEGLSELLRTAIESKAGPFESSHGQVVFERGGTPDDATYAAAYNYFFVQKDGSRGIHNPTFTIDVLQSSINAVGGKTPDS